MFFLNNNYVVGRASTASDYRSNRYRIDALCFLIKIKIATYYMAHFMYNKCAASVYKLYLILSLFNFFENIFKHFNKGYKKINGGWLFVGFTSWHEPVLPAGRLH